MINTLLITSLVLVLLIIASIVTFFIYRKLLCFKILKEHQIHTKNGIDKEIVIEIGGIKQFLYIRGHNIHNPIILFLHGGPGGAMTPMLYKYQYGWENDYTVVNWDQRNAGRTYFLNKNQEDKVIASLTVDRLVEDIREIVTYLSERFQQDKIIIMGHSWGTIIGSLFVKRYPELTKAYIGVAQVVHLNDGVALMAAELRKLALTLEETKDVEALNQLENSLYHNLKATERTVVEMYKLAKKYIPYKLDPLIFLKAGLMSPYFSLRHLTYFPKMETLQASLSEYITKHDLRKLCSTYEVPVIYMVGEYDLHLKYILEQYYPMINAPYKNFVYIKEAGHIAMMDQPDEFCNALTKSLQELNNTVT